ncbi:nucleoside-triphosphatase [Winogradskyella sp. PE311]|uniref:nucleoside-triphosphatase n=1 Tax=Winogradskyella sp. PE311 TaxID=3366943 RepID=UPI00397FAD36
MIYILTGNIRTGKTTALLNWAENRNDVDGLLCPDNENGKRYFLKVKSLKNIQLEVENESEETIAIGRFNFLKSAFDEANKFLINLNFKKESRYIIIDELGKLELKNEGLHKATDYLISKHKNHSKQSLILVVRLSLLQEVLKHFQITNYKLLELNRFKISGLD